MPADVTEKSWKKTKKEMDDSVKNLILAIQKLSPADLKKNIPGRKDLIRYVLDGVSWHTIYHSGQISMIKSALKRSNISPK